MRKTKRQQVLDWAEDRDWFYLNEVPKEKFNMSLATASTALIEMCERGIMEFRVVGLKQYRIKNGHSKQTKALQQG